MHFQHLSQESFTKFRACFFQIMIIFLTTISDIPVIAVIQHNLKIFFT